MVTRVSRRALTTTRVQAVDGDSCHERRDQLVTEEPMEIRLCGPGQDPVPLVVTMRTPGHDFELAAGFCVTEGVVESPAQIASIAYCLEGQAEQHHNVVTVGLRSTVDLAQLAPRRFVANASCGLCGKITLDDVESSCAPVALGPGVSRSVLVSLPDRLRAAQPLFDATGGLHAAARFDPDGTLVGLREDVGRHNALDKLVGESALHGALPLVESVLLVSGRMSFEIVQKAAVAGIPVLCAVSAPSSLAVAAAERLGQTLVGFLRGPRFNVYAHPERVELAS